MIFFSFLFFTRLAHPAHQTALVRFLFCVHCILLCLPFPSKKRTPFFSFFDGQAREKAGKEIPSLSRQKTTAAKRRFFS